METVYSIQNICLLTAAAVVFTAGLLINSFIVGVNIIDCWKRRPMTSADQILFCIGLSRWIFLVSCLGDTASTFVHHHVFGVMLMPVIMKVLLLLFNHFSLWLSTLLSTVFCLKISNFNNILLSRVKNFILQKVVHLIFISLLLSAVYTTVGAWLYCEELVSLDMPTKLNISQNMQLSVKYGIFYIMENAAPYVFNCIVTILALRSLCLHLSRMRVSDNMTAHLDTYYTAIKCTASCFVTYTLHIIFILLILDYAFLINKVIYYCIISFFPSVHSAYLIYITTRLRNQFSRLVDHGRKCLFNRESGDQVKSCSGQNCPGPNEEPSRPNENIPMS